MATAPTTSVYPNPSFGDVTLCCPAAVSGQAYLIRVYDVSGQGVCAEECVFNQSKAYINLQHLDKGMYFIEIGELGLNAKLIMR